MGDALPARRGSYRPRLGSSDHHIVRLVGAFVERALDAHVRAGSAVLDVGCGEQPLRAGIEARGGRYTGVDVTQNAAGSVDVVASAEDVPLPDAAYDVVLCTEVLEHVPDGDAAFDELARLVRPGGVVVVTVPFLYRLHEEPHDHRRVTPHGVRRWAERAGLRVEELAALGNEAHVLATVWGGVWEAVARPRWMLLRVPLRLAQRVACGAANLAASAATALAPRAFPGHAHLDVAAVLRRAPAAERAT